MLLYFVVGLRTCCIAAVLLLVTLGAGEPPHPLLGATRDQLLNRFGEPRSQLSTGGREVWFYPRERLVLINGVVTEVERLAAEAPPKAPTPAPADPNPVFPPTIGGRAPESTAPAQTPDAAAPSQPPPPVEPKFEIKLVRPPSATTPLPVDPVAPAPLPNPTVSPSVVPETVAPTPAKGDSAIKPLESSAVATDVTVAPTPIAEPSSKVGANPVRASAPPPSPAAAAPSSTSVPSPESGSFGSGTLIIAGVLFVGVIGLLFWRSRQRQLDLAATSVGNTPMAATLAANGRFTQEFLAQLDASRFEALVTDYYGKTGVIAVRTNRRQGSPVQIQISWKGESRPFALVHCIPQPPAPIEAKPLQELITVLKAEGIRRGYVVTSGNFIPAARLFAEEKHLTLLAGDAFVEKLNALPDSARAELAQVIGLRDSNASR